MLKLEEYVYMDLHLNMSTKQMSDVLYAGIITDSKFTTLWTLGGKEYTRKQNSRNGAVIKVHVHPDKISEFEELSGLKLIEPPKISGCYEYGDKR